MAKTQQRSMLRRARAFALALLLALASALAWPNAPARADSASTADTLPELAQLRVAWADADANEQTDADPVDVSAGFLNKPAALAKHYRAIAAEHEPAVTAALRSLESETRQLVGLDHRLKGVDSFARKALTNAGDEGITLEEAAAGISDALRYTYLCDVETFTADFLEIRAALEGQGYEWVRVSNTLGDATVQYRGVNTKAKTPDGYVFEIQFHTQESFDVYNATHSLYEEQRLLDTSTEEGEARFEELAAIMTEMSAGITTPPGIEQVTL